MTSISRMNVTTPKPRSNGTRCSRRTYKRRIPTAAQPTLSVPKGASDAPGKSPNDFDHCVLGCWGDSMRPRFRGRNALETPVIGPILQSAVILGVFSGLPHLPHMPFRHTKTVHTAADSLPLPWKPSSRLALESQFVRVGLAPLITEPAGLVVQADPRR